MAKCCLKYVSKISVIYFDSSSSCKSESKTFRKAYNSRTHLKTVCHQFYDYSDITDVFVEFDFENRPIQGANLALVIEQPLKLSWNLLNLLPFHNREEVPYHKCDIINGKKICFQIDYFFILDFRPHFLHTGVQPGY